MRLLIVLSSHGRIEYSAVVPGASSVMSIAEVAVPFMNSTEAREKSLKFLNGLARVLFTFSHVKQHEALAKSLSQGRSILRIAQHGNQLTAIRDMVQKGDLSTQQQLTVTRYFFELGFLSFNNVALFSKWGLTKLSAEAANYNGTLCLIAVYTIATIVDVMKLVGLDAAKLKGGAAEYHAQWRRALLDLCRHLCDVLASISNANISRALTVSDRTIGLLGAFSGFAACYINWKAAEDAVHRKAAKSGESKAQ